MLCQRISWTSRDPPLVSPQMQASQAVWRIPWTSRDPPLGSPQTQAPMLSGGSRGHPGILPWDPLRHRPPCCPETVFIDWVRSTELRHNKQLYTYLATVAWCSLHRSQSSMRYIHNLRKIQLYTYLCSEGHLVLLLLVAKYARNSRKRQLYVHLVAHYGL